MRIIIHIITFFIIYTTLNSQSLYTTGWNSVGQLGDGTNVDKNTHIRIGTGTDWQSISAGGYYTIGIKTDGSLWAWGSNNYSQLGDGTNTDKNTPIRIGTGTDWQSISAGFHTIGIKTDGSLWAWGRNYEGQLGDGTNTEKNIPTRIGTGTDWQSISAGFQHTIGIRTDGSLWAWGYNYAGQLGDGTNTDKNTPIRIGTGTDWQSISAGRYHTIALQKAPPTLTTTAISSILSTTASSGGNVTANNGAPVTARGVVWNTATSPTIALATKTSDGSGNGSFASSITGLNPGTLYYVRAYATNSAGTAYGSELSFTTLNIPSLTTNVPDNITGIDARSGANIINDGNDPITSKGLVWSTNPNPTIALATKTNEGSGASSFISTIIGLSYTTDYYVRAYATNSSGTAYGQQELFTSNTSSKVTLSEIYLTGDRGFTFTSVGTDDGGNSITERGVVWSLARNPKTTNDKKTHGSGLGLFSGTVFGLEPESKYYVRTYLINVDGTSYSENNIIYMADLDAVPTSLELNAPNNGDGNGDGIPDYAQRNVVTIKSSNGNYVTIASLDASLEVITPQAYKSLERNNNYEYPHGMYSFNINASSATVTIYFHGISNLSNAVYRKATTTGLWANYPNVTFSSIMLGGQRVATATLILQDGQYGDSDGIVNGVITDPGGPAVPISALFNIPTLNEWSRLVVILSLLLFGAYRITKSISKV